MPAKTKPNKPTASRAAKRPAVVEVKIDRALKRRWDELSAVLAAARREGASAFDQLWETVAAIVEHEPPVYLAGGFASARAFLAEHLGETERTAWRNMRVAKYASPAEEARFGTSKLDAALTFVEAQAGGPIQGRLPVDFDKLRIPVERSGKSARLPLAEASVQEIAAASRKLLRKGNATPAKTSPTVKAIVGALKAPAVRGVTVRIAGGKLWFGAVPTEAIEEFAQALSKVRVPKSG